MNQAIEKNINRLFYKSHRAQVTRVILLEIRNKRVVLQCPNREDRFTIPIAEFNKKYCLMSS